MWAIAGGVVVILMLKSAKADLVASLLYDVSDWYQCHWLLKIRLIIKFVSHVCTTARNFVQGQVSTSKGIGRSKSVEGVLDIRLFFISLFGCREAPIRFVFLQFGAIYNNMIVYAKQIRNIGLPRQSFEIIHSLQNLKSNLYFFLFTSFIILLDE